MAAGEPDKSEKTDPPSPFKLREAKKKGNVFKSMEVNSAFAVLVGIVVLVTIGPQFIQNVLRYCSQLLSNAGSISLELVILSESLQLWSSDGLSILSPIVLIMLVSGIVSTTLQTGLVFSTEPLKLDFKRLNPVEGFKRVFNIRLLFETVKSILKLAAFSAVAYVIITNNLPTIYKFELKSVYEIVPGFLDIATVLLISLLVVSIFFAIIDLIFVRWQYMKRMRMSKKEVKDEIKRREGDPMVKAKRKELDQELRKRSQSTGNAANADLIITNPSRYAIAIKYDRTTMLAPMVIAKGADDLAATIRQVGYRNSIPIFCVPPLARAIYKKVKIDRPIPEAFFTPVARLFGEVYRAEKEGTATYG